MRADGIMKLLYENMLLRENIEKFYQDKNDFIIKQQELKINYMEKTSIKSYAKKIKCYQISISYCKLSANYPAKILEF